MRWRYKAFVHLARVLVAHPSQVKYVQRWRSTWHSSPLQDQQPWISFAGRDWFESVLRSDMKVFEYGSGGSTLYFAARVRELVSVEHDRKWYGDVKTCMAAAGFATGGLVLRTPEPMQQIGDGGDYAPSRFGNPHTSLQKYVSAIDAYPDRTFDIVFIDGRCRTQCAAHALPKVRPGGYIVLDNSERPSYEAANRLLAKYPKREFQGLCPHRFSLPKTTAWRITAQPNLNAKEGEHRRKPLAGT
jgi:hypothetical protein